MLRTLLFWVGEKPALYFYQKDKNTTYKRTKKKYSIVLLCKICEKIERTRDKQREAKKEKQKVLSLNSVCL